MTKRGRPKKNGLQPGWMLLRRMEALYAYGQARMAGEKHSAAVREAVKAVREKHPSMRISETEVRRILADWQPKNVPTVIVVGKPDRPDEERTLPDGQKAKTVLSLGFGSRPNYPRTNARPTVAPTQSPKSDPPPASS